MRYFGTAATAAPPGSPEVFEVTAAPEGAWPTLGGAPFSFNGYTYIGYSDNTGLFRVAAYNESTGVTTSVTVGGPVATPDQHNLPALLRRSSDDKLVAVLCDHNALTIYARVSTNALTADPTISGGWTAAVNIDSQLGGTRYTYPALFEFDGEILLFYRDNDGVYNWEISTHALDTSDMSTGWSAFTNLAWAARAYGLAYQSSATRLDFVVSDGSYCSDKASLYHFYYDGTNFKDSAGVNLAGTPPYAFAAMTKVYDGATSGVRAPGALVNDGTEIAVVFPVMTGTCGPYIGADEDYIYCRATVGSATWTNKTVATAIGGLTVDFTEGMLAIDPADIDHLIVSRRASSDIGLPFHLYDYLTADAGDNWTVTNVSVSGDPDLYPWFVLDYTAALEYVWLKGTPTSSTSFDFGIQGYGTGG